MIAGIAVAAKSLRPSIKIYGAEPCGTNDAADVAASVAAGRLVSLPKPATIACGLQARLGSVTWPLVRDLVDGVIVVSEEEIVRATNYGMEHLKVVVEPSGATALAATLSPDFGHLCRAAGLKRVGIILSGGNLDLNKWLGRAVPSNVSSRS